MPTKPNNAVVVDACTRRLNALSSYVDGKAVIGINGRKLALPDVVAIYQECLDSRAELATQRAKATAAQAVRETKEEARREADRALRAWVEGEFGVGSKEAIDFGFPAAKRGVLSVEQKAQAVAQAKATREARHTMGKRQKGRIKGSLPPQEQQEAQAELFGGAPAAAPVAGK